MNGIKLTEAIKHFLLEDIGYGDRTAEALFSNDASLQTAVIVAKENGIFAGKQVLTACFPVIDPAVTVHCNVHDGVRIKSGEVIAEIHGHPKALLQGERVLLNLLQRMAGIATATANAVTQLNDSSISICDTRKTAPGLRAFDKEAVKIGGGKNHRFGLDDGIMLKENHIASCGSITKAIELLRMSLGPMVKIEVETTSKEEVLEAVAARADIIMFDNASPEEIEDYMNDVPKEILTEASGGIQPHTLSSYAGTGVDFISLGYLTHSVKALDLSLLVKEKVFI